MQRKRASGCYSLERKFQFEDGTTPMVNPGEFRSLEENKRLDGEVNKKLAGYLIPLLGHAVL